jgi:hypothetical protein
LSSSGALSDSRNLFDQWRQNGLTWLPARGVGYYPPAPANEVYDAAYFAHYAALADTAMGAMLNLERMALVARHWQGFVVDVGIGAGAFVTARPGTAGYDVNPLGVAWLRERALFLDPYGVQVEAACFWDSLDVTVPIFRDLPDVLASKHYKPGEHCWYFTQRGLLEFMGAHGFMCDEINDRETRIGREAVKSFAFRRE